MECKSKMKFPWFTYVTWFVCLGNTWCKSIKTMAKVRWSKALMLTTLPQNSDFCVIQHYSGACPLLAGPHKIHWSIQCTAPNFFGNAFFFITVFYCSIALSKYLYLMICKFKTDFIARVRKLKFFLFQKCLCTIRKVSSYGMCKYRVWLEGKKENLKEFSYKELSAHKCPLVESWLYVLSYMEKCLLECFSFSLLLSDWSITFHA